MKLGWAEPWPRNWSGAPVPPPWPEKPEDQLEAEEELLNRLVDLNHQRAAEEAKGKICRLRPDYQAPEETATQGELATDSDATTPDKSTKRPSPLGTRPYKPKSDLSAIAQPPVPGTRKTWPPTSNANPKRVSSRLSKRRPNSAWSSRKATANTVVGES